MRKLQKNSNTKYIAIAIVLILAISIGYAALSTTLTINGTANVASNSWLIYFTNVQVKSGSVTATTVPTTSGTSTTTLTWAVNLQMPGDFYEYNVDVKNDGTINAMIGSLSNTSLTTNQAKYLDYTVTYSDGAVIEQYDKLDSGETITLKVRVEYKTDLNPEDLPSTAESTSFTYESNYVQADSNAKNRNKIPLHIGDTVNYTTTMNGVTLNNWKVFYTDGDYTTLILSDYLPNSAIDTTQTGFTSLIKSTSAPTYGVYDQNNRVDLFNALQTKSNWTSLLSGTVNGTPINYSGTTDTNIWAMGAPTLDLYVNSWNAKYPNDTIYTDTIGQVDGLTGYYIGLSENQHSYWIDAEDMQLKEGYNDLLYYPHQENVDGCFGYWLATASANGYNYLFAVQRNGYIGLAYCQYTRIGLSPCNFYSNQYSTIDVTV